MNLHAQLHKYLRAYPQWNFAPPRVQFKRSVEKFGSDCGGYFLGDLAPKVMVHEWDWRVREPMRFPTGVWYLFAVGAALFCVKSSPAAAARVLA